MQEPYQNYFEMSIVQFMAFPEVIKGEGPIVETLGKLAADPFFTAVEVGPVNDAGVRREAAQLLKSAHMKVGYGGQPIVLLNKLNPNSPDAGERKKAVDMLKQGIDQAYDLGAGRMGFLSGPAPADPGDREAQLGYLIESINELCEYAESQGELALTLETFDGDIDKKALVGPNADGVRVSEAVRKSHPSFGLMLDLSHFPIQHENTVEALEGARDHLVHAHLGNCVMRDTNHPAYGDMHPRFGVDGGENDVDEVVEYLETLFRIGFIGGKNKPFVGFEVKPMQGESSEVIIANTKRVFFDAWARVKR